MDFTDDSLAQRRNQRLQEVARMEATAVGGRAKDDILVLDTSLHSHPEDSSRPGMLRRAVTFDASSSARASSFRRATTSDSGNSNSSERRPSDMEIRSLWRLKVMQLKMDDLYHH